MIIHGRIGLGILGTITIPGTVRGITATTAGPGIHGTTAAGTTIPGTMIPGITGRGTTMAIMATTALGITVPGTALTTSIGTTVGTGVIVTAVITGTVPAIMVGEAAGPSACTAVRPAWAIGTATSASVAEQSAAVSPAVPQPAAALRQGLLQLQGVLLPVA